MRPWKLPSQTMIVARSGRDALDLVAPLAGGLDRRLDGLGARVHRQDALLAGQRGEVARERAELVVGERAARQRHAIELRVRGGDEARVAVAEVQRAVGRQRVEVAAAAVVVHPGALGVGDRDRQRVVVVSREALGERAGVARAAEPHVERQRQAARPAAGLEELRHVDHDGLEAAGAELCFEARRARRHDDGAPDDDRVGAEGRDLLVGEDDRVGHQRAHEARALRVELVERDERAAGVQRAEDDVEVVEALVGQLDGQDPRVDDPREVDIGRGRRARAIRADERAVEGQRVPRALLHDVVGRGGGSRSRAAANQRSASAVSPRRSGWRMRAGMKVSPSTRPRLAVKTRSGRSGSGASDLDLRAGRAQRRDERVPLALRPRAVDRHGDVHPRVDRVGDVEVGGRAHEKAPRPR